MEKTVLRAKGAFADLTGEAGVDLKTELPTYTPLIPSVMMERCEETTNERCLHTSTTKGQ
jgi:hypothetical protein